jgi:hypothetical protein
MNNEHQEDDRSELVQFLCLRSRERQHVQSRVKTKYSFLVYYYKRVKHLDMLEFLARKFDFFP